MDTQKLIDLLETNYNLFNTNPTKDDLPYDFDTKFINQQTVYSDKIVDSTSHAYNSLSCKVKDYKGEIV